ncbi:MAG: hypothetical protein HZB76_05385 [Chlamydiae bacterium]|nr:hypothetical protein [Chlamydiota bacterium]
MKITSKILNIPPFISTSWENIESIYMHETTLVIVLKNNSKVEIPNLGPALIKIIFDSHAKFIEEQSLNLPNKGSINFGLPLIEGGGELDALTSSMKHNPEQANMPNIPEEVLKKITAIAKLISDETPLNIPKPEQNCNCPHCQIARAMQTISGINPENLDPDVSEDELKFRNWDIKEMGEKLYIVSNPLDSNEQYTVFLGEPIGCTCGKNNCEHIKSVLNT